MKKLFVMMFVGLVLVALMFVLLGSAFETAFAGKGNDGDCTNNAQGQTRDKCRDQNPVDDNDNSSNLDADTVIQDNEENQSGSGSKRCDAYLYITEIGTSAVTYKGNGTLCLVLPTPGTYNLAVTH